MGKRRKTGGVERWKPKVHYQREAPTSSLLDPTSREFVYDEIDDFEDQTDNVALSDARTMMTTKKASREQVLAIDVDTSDDNDDDDDVSDEDEVYMEDDIVEERKEWTPDDRAWGTDKRRYIGTDTSDERIHKRIRGGDDELARLEEEAARKLQERLAAELHHLPDDDLIPQGTFKDESGKGAKESKVETALELNLSGLSRSKKLQLLRRESPEFLPLLDDLKAKCDELHVFLGPLMEGVRGGLVTSPTATEYITTKYRLILNYVTVVGMYMLIKASKGNARDHPILGRLAQYRQMMQELVSCDQELEPELKKLIPVIKAAKTNKMPAVAKKTRKPKKLQILQKGKSITKASVHKTKLDDMLANSDSSDEERQQQEQDAVLDQEAEASNEEDAEVENTPDQDSRRAITYQISKNKGLLPSRKKEQRNPRVKYRMKYDTKLKKRKGQVRLVKREVKRYEGEVSGIRSHTIKSIKIK